MNGRRPVTDPRSSQPAGSWSLLATLDAALPSDGSAIATVHGTGRKERVWPLFPGTAYSAGTVVWVSEVQGKLRAFAVSNGAGAGGGSNCDLTRCVDSGIIKTCSVGEACHIYLATGLDLGSAYAPDAPVSPVQFEHVADCTWESVGFLVGNNNYLWRLTASGAVPTIELIYVSGPDQPLSPIIYQGPKPFAPLCGNEFWCHQQPGTSKRRAQAHYPEGSGDPIYPPVLPSRVCLTPEFGLGACGACQELTSPRYMRVAVGPGANAAGAEHCSGIAWDIVCQTPIEQWWEATDPNFRVACSWFGYGACGPLALPPGGDASGFNALPYAHFSITGGEVGGVPWFTALAVVQMWWATPGFLPCDPQWEIGPPQEGFVYPSTSTLGVWLEATFELTGEDFDCLASHALPFKSYRQWITNEFGDEFPVFWEPGHCDFSGLTCTVEPSA